MKEDKMTLPGIQVAHIKCLDSTSLAADVISKLALIPLMVGYSPSTWQNGIDSMIPKKVADLRPEKLRLILLMDARFNHNNKLIGKKMMEYGEQHNLLAPEQFGSRRCKSAIEHAINKRLVLDIVWQSGSDAVYVANDAKSCYDRILLLVAYLTMRKFGIPSLVAKSTISTIMMMKHRVRTKYGDSHGYYGGDKWKLKPHGCGQGNGYGPALWACISSPLLHLLRQHGYGTHLQCPISNKEVRIAAFAFVDDVDIIQMRHMNDTRHVEDNNFGDLMIHTQDALHHWASVLRVTGGVLEPLKTFFVPIATQWKGNKKIVTSPSQSLMLTLKGENSCDIQLQQYKPTESFFTLGIWQSPPGIELRQQEHLLQQIRKWGTDTTLRKINWAQARIALRSTIGKTLTYSLAATTFTSNQCKQLQTEFLRTTLGKMGIVRTTPPLLATAPCRLGGFGLLSFEITQLIHHISLILLHGPDEESMTHNLLCATLECYSLEAGLPGDPLRLPLVEYVTPNTWISQTLYSINKFHIEISSSFPGLETWCEQDNFVMDKLQYSFSLDTLSTVNKVRLFLKVTTLADLVSADGTSYCTELLRGNRNNDHPIPSSQRYNWPAVPPPTRSEKATWFHYLSTAFGISLTTGYTRSNITVKWSSKAVLFSNWLLSHSTQYLYENKGHGTWSVWIKSSQCTIHNTRSSQNTYSCSHDVSQVPGDCRPISICRMGVFVRTVGKPGVMSTTLANNTEPIRDPRRTGPSNSHLGQFLYYIQLSHGIVVTDGSFANGHATYAFLAQARKFDCPLDQVPFEDLVCDSGCIVGSIHDSNSYRAELAGILAAITFTNHQCKIHHIKNGKCMLYCDSKGALNAAFGYKRPTP